MKIRTMIIDDEPLAREGIRLRLAGENDIDIIDEIDSGSKAIQAINLKEPDLIFLDIQMPGIDGFGVLKKIEVTRMPVIIFVTAYDAYALDAFQTHALDYLLKPVEDARFTQSLNRAREILQDQQLSSFGKRIQSFLNESGHNNIHSILENAKTEPGPRKKLERIAIKSRGVVTFLHVREIDWIEAAGDYVYLHGPAGKFLLREKMSFFEKNLPSQSFQRVHRSAIVNLDQIKELRYLNPNEQALYLHDGTELKLSRTYSKKFQEAVGGFF